jgi:DnaJ-class molecular chaperone
LSNSDYIDFYTILGVSQYAKYREIKAAYRRLALKYHPDRNSSTFAEDAIKRINAAFEILSDKDKRRQYDKVAVFNNIVLMIIIVVEFILILIIVVRVMIMILT